MSFTWFVLALALYCREFTEAGTGQAQQTFENTGIFVDVSIDLDNSNLASITLVSPDPPTTSWFGVGFESTSMDGNIAVIIYQHATDGEKCEFWTLGNHAPGTYVSDCDSPIFDTIDGDYTVTFTMDGADHDFPTSFDVPISIDIMVAVGNQVDYESSTGMASKDTSNTFEFVDPENAYVSSTNDQDTATDGAVSADSGICFSSDSYVITEGYVKKNISDLNIYDKILTFDSINNLYFFDELLVKIHFNENEYLNKELIPMIELVLDDGSTLTMSGNHLLYVGEYGLDRADQVKIGDKLKQFNKKSAVTVIQINNVMKYPRNLITYNGNLVINGIAISTFVETIWGENKYWGKSLRFIMKYFYDYNVWRYPAYYTAKLWNEYFSFDTKEYILRFYFSDDIKQNREHNSYWFSSIFSGN